MTLFVDAEVTIICESVRPGCEFRALFFDRQLSQFFGGSGATSLEALAWAMDEYVRRGLHGHHSPARRTTAPGDGLAATSSRPRRITPAPIVRGPVEQPANTNAEAGCFEQQIPTAPAPRFFSLESPVATSTPTTPRRARGGRR